jgi:elongation factor G
MQTDGAAAQSKCVGIARVLEQVAMTRDLNKLFFRETVQGSSTGESRFVRKRGPRNEFAHVRVSVRAAERGRGAILAWNAGTKIPVSFSPAVLRGIQDALAAGASGFEVTDISVTVDSGSFHDLDSNDEAFREAAHEATLQAIQQASPIILEAMSLVLITLPANLVELAELAVGRRGGEATPAVPTENGSKALAANVPASAVNELFEELLRVTGGSLKISSRANGYRPRIEPTEDNARRGVTPRRR